MVKNLPANAGDVGLILGSGTSPGGGHGNPLQYCCLENLVERSLVGYSPQCLKESDMSEAIAAAAANLSLFCPATFSFPCIDLLICKTQSTASECHRALLPP